MSPRHRAPIRIASSSKLMVVSVTLAGLAAGCAGGPTPDQGAGVASPTLEPPAAASPTHPRATAPSLSRYSDEQRGFCLSIPQGFTLQPYNDVAEVVGPYAASGPEPGLFWMDVRDAEGQTAQQVAEQDLAAVPGLNPDRSTVMLGGEEALVLDGMPGQDLVRRVYVVHQESLYTLTFSPTRSETAFAEAQMGTLFTVVTGSWAWSPCGSGN
jgi:hypothetical protein